MWRAPWVLGYLTGLQLLLGTSIAAAEAQPDRAARPKQRDQVCTVPDQSDRNASAQQGTMRRTVVFVRAKQWAGLPLFVRGGAQTGCAGGDARGCPVPISHRNLSNPYTAAWKAGDTALDWNVRQPEQRERLAGLKAAGTPLDWTTDSWAEAWGPTHSVAQEGFGVEPLNTYGPGYFMLDVDMDCSSAYHDAAGNAWFELRAYWGPHAAEPPVHQADAPYPSDNHFARCGMLNVFEIGSASVQVAPLDAPEPPAEVAQLPPWLTYCTAEQPCAADASLRTCSADAVSCEPTGRQTTLSWTIDGLPFSALGVFINTSGTGVNIQSDSPNVISFGPLAAVQGAAQVSLIEGGTTPVEAVSYYDVAPRWGEVTPIEFESVRIERPEGTAWFFKHTSFDYGMSSDGLTKLVADVYQRAVALTGIVPPAYRAFFIPAELVAGQGDGNFAFPPDTVTVNYGNPPWLSYIGGFQTSVQWEWAHELSHLLFQPIAGSFGNGTCLNEGLADAVGNKLGYIPESDFHPLDASLSTTCRGFPGPHAIGNCYLWHLKHYGADEQTDGPYWNERTFAGLFAPSAQFQVDTCATPAGDLTQPTPMDLANGDEWVVYFSDATGADMTDFVVSLGFFSSGSYQASRDALGL